MGRPKLLTVKLAEAVKTVNQGVYADRLEYDEDEQLVLRSPGQQPSRVLRLNNSDFMKWLQRPEEDPERVEFERKQNVGTYARCIVDWVLRDAKGHLRPPPDDSTIEQAWDALPEDEQGFFMDIIREFYIQRAIDTLMKPRLPEEDLEKNSTDSSMRNGSNSPSSVRDAILPSIG